MRGITRLFMRLVALLGVFALLLPLRPGRAAPSGAVPFGAKSVITHNTPQAYSVYAADVDGDVDVLYDIHNPDRVRASNAAGDSTWSNPRSALVEARVYLPLALRDNVAYFEGPWEEEDNDTYLAANGALRSDRDYYGYPDDTKDYFSLYLRGSSDITIDLSGHTGQGVQLQLFYQSVDSRVAYVTSPPYHIGYAGARGWYYIYIYTESGHNSDTSYMLRATFNEAPYVPSSPSPADNAIGQGVNVGLGWSGGDPNSGDTVTYDVHFEPNDSTPDDLVCNDVATPACDPGPLAYSTHYYWQVVARDSHGVIVAGPVWDFTTAPVPGWYEVGDGSATGGGISNNSGPSQHPSIATAPDGTPYVVWYDNSGGDDEIYVRRWNGSSWEEAGASSATGGGISDNSDGSHFPSLAIGPNGTPYIAWKDESGGGYEIYVRRWQGSSWEEVGARSASGGGISDNSSLSLHPSVAIAPDGTPYVAWEDAIGLNKEIYVRRWNGSSWEEVGAGSASSGGISNNTEDSLRPSIAIVPDGTPYVAWYDESGGDFEIYVRRWNGSSWGEVGAGSASGGGISDNSGGSYCPSLAIAPDGTPYVAWQGSSGDAEIYVRRWNGSVWEEVGSGSASGGGISNNGGGSRYPWAAVAPDGMLYVAWDDDSGGDPEIYVRRWNGSMWEEVGVNSANDGGISNNSGSSEEPVVAIAPDGTPYIAWCDSSGGDWEVYVRRWME